MKKLHERAEWWLGVFMEADKMKDRMFLINDVGQYVRYHLIHEYCHKRYLIVLQQIKDAQ
jgi:hypothetical protein